MKKKEKERTTIRKQEEIVISRGRLPFDSHEQMLRVHKKRRKRNR